MLHTRLEYLNAYTVPVSNRAPGSGRNLASSHWTRPSPRCCACLLAILVGQADRAFAVFKPGTIGTAARFW